MHINLILERRSLVRRQKFAQKFKKRSFKFYGKNDGLLPDAQKPSIVPSLKQTHSVHAIQISYFKAPFSIVTYKPKPRK